MDPSHLLVVHPLSPLGVSVQNIRRLVVYPLSPLGVAVQNTTRCRRRRARLGVEALLGRDLE